MSRRVRLAQRFQNGGEVDLIAVGMVQFLGHRWSYSP